MSTSTPLRTRFTTFITAALIAASLLPGLAIQPAQAQSLVTADLSITMTAGAKHLRYLEETTNTIVVTNLGPDTATGVWLSTNVSDSLNPGDIVCADGTTIPNYELCGPVTLSPGQTATYLMTVLACCTCCPNRVGISTATVHEDEFTLDPNLDNNFTRVDTRFTGKFPT
jgi:hypothetical protein